MVLTDFKRYSYVSLAVGPHVYHEGFSLGDNFCEAFNFGTREWFQYVGKWASKILYYVLKLQIDLKIKSRSMQK